MTLILAWNGEMAADSMNFIGALRVAASPKIVRRADGALCGAAGISVSCHRFKEWFLSGCPEDRKPDIPTDGPDGEELQGLVMTPDGKIYRYDERLRSLCVSGPIGVGSESAALFALGAIYGGSGCGEAMALTIERINQVGGRVQLERLGCSAPAKI